MEFITQIFLFYSIATVIMASVNVSTEGDSFLRHAERVREEIGERFMRAHETLREREADLLAELQRLVDEYIGADMRDEMKEISDSKAALLVTLKGNQNRELLNQSIALLDNKMKELDSYRCVRLQWDETLEQRLRETGEVRINPVRRLVPDYSRVDKPVKVFGRHSKEDKSAGVFRFPHGIAIDPVSNYVYICDLGWDRVQVFDRSFNFIFLFSERMKGPAGICIKDNRIYVTQFESCCMNIYSTKGELLQSVGKKGKNELEFGCPLGLDISTEMNRVYIAERDNNRVQCLNLDMTFNSFIEDIYGASDVKLTSVDIVVLCYRSPCISLYNYSHQSIRSMVTQGEGCQVVNPLSICLDAAANILITDNESHCVCVFSHEGVMIHRFGREGEREGEFMEPRGIAMDCEGRIMVASENLKHCIQIFC